MLNKTKIVLSTLLVVGFASSASAYVFKIGDKYPLLEQNYSSLEQTYAMVQRPVQRSTAAGHVFADGRSHHADPDARIMAQLERDCSSITPR